MVGRVVSRIGLLAIGVVLAGCGGSATATSATPAVSPSASVAQASASPSPTTAPTPTATPSLDPNAGVERTDDRGVDQVWVPPGTFLMGTDGTDPTGELAPPDWARFELAAERPQHEVELSTGYWIDKAEVTNEAFQAFVDDGGYTTQSLW